MKRILYKKIFLLNIIIGLSFLAAGQKISEKELIEQTAETILIENFYQIDINDYVNFCKPTSIGFLEKEKCYIQNFQAENKLKGQLIIQLDFSGKVQFMGISKIFIDKYKKLIKPKMILSNSLEECFSGVNSNWQIANCLSNKIIEFISD